MYNAASTSSLIVRRSVLPVQLKVLLQIRDSIKALFPDRDCFPLVRPMSDEKALAKLETLDTKEMRPEFQEVCVNFSNQCSAVACCS